MIDFIRECWLPCAMSLGIVGIVAIFACAEDDGRECARLDCATVFVPMSEGVIVPIQSCACVEYIDGGAE